MKRGEHIIIPPGVLHARKIEITEEFNKRTCVDYAMDCFLLQNQNIGTMYIIIIIIMQFCGHCILTTVADYFFNDF